MPEQRKLAVIVFMDISGYTALMGKDEDQADRYAICDVRCEICDFFGLDNNKMLTT
jgi:class 3 adenylate cyclase